MPSYNTLIINHWDGYPSGTATTRNYGNNPENWPKTYIDDATGKTYRLECQCSPTVISYPWFSKNKITQAQCSGIGGNWSPPSGYSGQPNAVGNCNGPHVGDCTSYYSLESIGGIDVIPAKYAWRTFPQNLPYYAGSIEVDPCNISFARELTPPYNYLNLSDPGGPSRIDPNNLGDPGSDKRKAFVQGCHNLSSVLVGCDPKLSYNLVDRNPDYGFQQDTPDTTITAIGPGVTTGSMFDYITPVLIGSASLGTVGVIAKTLADWWNNKPKDGGGPPKVDRPSGPVISTSAQLGGKEALEIIKNLTKLTVVAAGSTIVILLLPEVIAGTVVAGAASYMVIIYNEGGTATVLTVTIPPNSA